MTSTAEVIKEFQNVTGADADTSKFYLESSGWDISVSLPAVYLLHQSRRVCISFLIWSIHRRPQRCSLKVEGSPPSLLLRQVAVKL